MRRRHAEHHDISRRRRQPSAVANATSTEVNTFHFLRNLSEFGVYASIFQDLTGLSRRSIAQRLRRAREREERAAELGASVQVGYTLQWLCGVFTHSFFAECNHSLTQIHCTAPKTGSRARR